MSDANENSFKVLGINDDKDFCECCGKNNLKKVVWIEHIETNDVRHFGVNCAQSAKHAFGLTHEIKRALKDFEEIEARKYKIAHSLYRSQGGKYEGDSNGGWRPVDTELFNVLVLDAKVQLLLDTPSTKSIQRDTELVSQSAPTFSLQP